MTAKRGMFPLSRIQIGIGGSLVNSRKSEQTSEAIEWIVTAVKPKSELIQICLKVLGTDAVVRSAKPCLQVTKDHVNHRQVVICDLSVPILGRGKMVVSEFIAARNLWRI